MYGKLCRHWSGSAFLGIWSGSALFAKGFLTQYLGLLGHSKRKGFATLGESVLSFRVDPFSEGAWCAGKKINPCPAE